MPSLGKKTKRYVIAVTETELGMLRGGLDLVKMSFWGDESRAANQATTRYDKLLVKLDGAQAVTEADYLAYDFAAGDLMDAAPESLIERGKALYNGAYRFRYALDIAFGRKTGSARKAG